MGASEDDVTKLYSSTDKPDFWKMFRVDYDKLKLG